MSEPDAPQAASRFVMLLAMLIALLLVAPILVASGLPDGAARITMGIALIGVLLAAINTARTRRRQMLVAASLASLVIVLQTVVLISENPVLEVARLSLGIVALAYVITIVLRHVFTSRRVTADTIAASLCVYLLIGVVWSMVYSLIENLTPGSFRYAYGVGDFVLDEFAGQQSIFSLYLSFVTLSTLGYGDVVAVSNTGRMFAVTEAITGQIYLAVLVARLVGMHIAESVRS